MSDGCDRATPCTMYPCNGTEPTRAERVDGADSALNRVGVFTRSVSAPFAWVMIVSSPHDPLTMAMFCPA